MAAATSCALLSLLGVILLTMFGAMFNNKAISFQIVAVEHHWDSRQKANSCFNAALLYAATLFLSMVARIYTKRSEAARAVAMAQARREMALM